jgi:CheY-like chemotaxis protein
MKDDSDSPSAPTRGSVLIVDDDFDIASLVEQLLADEGFSVSTLADRSPEAIQSAVGRLEPDCVLLDSAGPLGFGSSWQVAADLAVRGRRIPVIMCTAHQEATREAAARESARSQAAGFSAIVPKPFDVDVLVTAVAQAVGKAVPFDQSAQADQARTQALVDGLRHGGATELRAGTVREWVIFRAVSGHLVQVFWAPQRGVYYVTRWAADGAVMEPLGHFANPEEAIARALTG